MTFPLIHGFAEVFNILLETYFWIVVLAVVASWLIAFGVINTRNNDLARQLVNMLFALTEPVFRQIRKIIPAIGGVDFSPFIVGIAIQVILTVGNDYLASLMAWSLRQS
jgi:YggT family protein